MADVPRECFIYAIGPTGGPYKVGFTFDLKLRLEGIQTHIPQQVEIAASISAVHVAEARLIERRVHHALSAYRVRGEWFDCDLDVIVAALNAPQVVHQISDGVLDHATRTVSDFTKWMEASGLSVRKAALALGCSNNAVLHWKVRVPPKYVLMACYAHALGINPAEE